MTDHALTRQLETWFKANARDLPWRLDIRDPYQALVSEFMLQQTQVSRVLEKYQPFLNQFPDIHTLARAPEETVLAAWAGLGYYRRARMLHACAQAIVKDHAGMVPDAVDQLIKLPGIGRYTAGAIASMVFHQREPIVDGNVIRVLMRVENKAESQTDKETIKWTWKRAEQLVNASSDPAAFNEAMMELGATCCTPKNIGCDRCPIRAHCRSYEAGTTESVPRPQAKAKQKKLYCATIISTQSTGTTQSILLEQRPATGMWAKMYQAPTIECDDHPPDSQAITTHLGVGADRIEPAGKFTHITTHRIVEFRIYRVNTLEPGPNQAYRTIHTLDQVAISNAQRKGFALAGIL